MALCRYREAGTERWGWVRAGRVYPVETVAVTALFTAPGAEGLKALARQAAEQAAFTLADDESRLLAPVLPGQEVWAAGVTYESSKFARMAESEGGGDFYARVYVAERPELFLKATPRRVVGQNAPVRLRADSKWNVPEPELTVVLAANGQILGFTVGNDMSSRDIEGENPLYLPQAKVYRGSCALGPVVVPADDLNPQNLAIRLTITRQGETAFSGETSTARMRRTVEELGQWLFRENDFPQGALLLTGTGLVPPDEFTLQPGDAIAIEIEGIGTLRNAVAAS